MQEIEVKKTGSKHRYLTFFLKDELYGIGIESVEEIIAMMKITSVPKTPKYVRGVMNLRGNIIPVVDMRIKFEMPVQEENMYTAIVIVAIEGTSIGFIVDTVEEVAQIAEESLSEAPRFGSGIDTSFISQMAQLEEKVIMLLDLGKIFDMEELAGMEKMSTQNKGE